MFAFYVTGASVRVWMGNEAPFCFSPSLLSQKSFIQGFPEPSGKARKRGERERKTRRSGSYFPDFFLKKEWRLEATSSFVHYGEKAPERDEEGEKRWRLGKKLQLSLSPSFPSCLSSPPPPPPLSPLLAVASSPLLLLLLLFALFLPSIP